MDNIQVTPNLNNARSESSLAINPNNPLQIVGALKKFINIKTYDFTLATSFWKPTLERLCCARTAYRVDRHLGSGPGMGRFRQRIPGSASLQ